MAKKTFQLKELCHCVQTRPHGAALHTHKLSGRGPTDARVMVVGLAPGMDEALSGRYFVGASGQQITKDLLTAGIVFDDCRIENVGCYWPPEHDLNNLTDEQRREGEEQLYASIKQVQPDLIIALGGDALEFLTGKSGVTKWRGSLLPLKDPSLTPATVLPTLHPSAVLQAWDYNYLVRADLSKASAFLRGEDVSPPKRSLITRLNSTAEEYRAACLGLVEDAKRGVLMAADIETYRGELACICFATDPLYSVSVHADDREIWQTILLASNPKIWHNAMYDVTFLEAKCGVKTQGVAHDTQLLWHALHPELACSEFVGKSLAVLVSLYTRDNYYKDARENWRKVADWNAFYEYNARDGACTLEIFAALQEELKVRDLIDGGRTRDVYDFEMALLEPYKNATLLGIKIDTLQKGIKKGQAKRRIADLTKLMCELVEDEGFNPRSHPQVAKYLKKFGSKELGTNKEAITNILIKSEEGSKLKQFAQYVKEFRDVSKAHDTYYSFTYDPDGRVRTNWIIPGTETGRMANSKSIIFEGGVNLMTIPRQARKFFVADDGYLLVYADLSQAEARLVAYLSGCAPMIEAFETGKDLYKSVAAQMFDKPVDDITYEERYLAKRCVLGLLYGMGTKTWRTQTNIDKGYNYMSQERAEELYTLFFIKFPEIKEYHRYIEKLIQRDRRLYSLFGRSREFRPRNGVFSDGLFREGYDYIPQATVPDIVNTGVLVLESLGQSVLIGQIHDAYLGQVKKDDKLDERLRAVHDALTIPLEITDINGVTRTITIPVDIAVGANWGDKDEVDNPNGLEKYKLAA
jgi:uracil-DNA glycosylase family 4